MGEIVKTIADIAYIVRSAIDLMEDARSVKLDTMASNAIKVCNLNVLAYLKLQGTGSFSGYFNLHCPSLNG